MAAPHREEEVDSLSSLEDRISRAVEVVGSLKHENQELLKRVEALEAERDRVQSQAQTSATEATKLANELEELRAERKQVRTRIEKLLGQMDLLTSS